MKVSTEVRGDTRIAQKLKLMIGTAKKPGPELLEFGNTTAMELRRKKYPPEVEGQRYQRTGELGRSWNAEPLGSDAVKISNDAKPSGGKYYAEYVVGAQQAWMHKSPRWWIGKDYVIERLNQAAERLRRAFTVIWNEK